MNTAVTDLLLPYTPDLCALPLAARRLVCEVMPAAVEQVDPADKLIGYGYGAKMNIRRYFRIYARRVYTSASRNAPPIRREHRWPQHRSPPNAWNS